MHKPLKIQWWLVAMILFGVIALVIFVTSPTNKVVFTAIASGIWVTVYVTLISYSLALLLGLGVGLMRTSQSRVLKEVASFYIELIRGLPMLVILYIIAFVGAPALAEVLNFILAPLRRAGLVEKILTRDINFASRAILALCLGYAAFIAEIVRAGIESVPKGQLEAAQALGMTRGQALRKIVLPQALKNVLPALANEFVAIIKDSALVSVLGVQDITQLGKVYSASTFRFFDTYMIVAFFYLCITISLSILVRRLEEGLKIKVHRRMTIDKKSDKAKSAKSWRKT